MVQESREILKKITQLVSLVESSDIQLIEKLKILKVLLTLKIKLIELLPLEPARARVSKNRSLDFVPRQRNDTLEKHELLLKFIREKGGRASSAELAGLGLAARSLRRYLRNLASAGKISLEKKGRGHFYSLI